jgi:hypothetical protein
VVERALTRQPMGAMEVGEGKFAAHFNRDHRLQTVQTPLPSIDQHA